jgi:hypothetical protein
VFSIVRFEVIASLAISRARSSVRTHADGGDLDVAAELLNDGDPAFHFDQAWKPPPSRGAFKVDGSNPRFIGYLIQLSTRRPRIRENSPVLSVTRTAPVA